MEQRVYNQETVQELLDWAKRMLETGDYPTERYQLNQSTVITNGEQFLQSLIIMVDKNWENPLYHPTVDQLWEFRIKWTKEKEA